MYCLNEKGKLTRLVIGSVEVPLRTDDYAPALTVTENGVTRDIQLAVTDLGAEGETLGAKIRVSLGEEGDALTVNVSVTAGADGFAPERLSLRTGNDSYMESYPEWNAQFYPTFLRCEKTHVWGYFRRTDGVMLAVAGDAVSSWRNAYNRVYYDPENFDDTGHRIYTTTLDLLDVLPQPKRHPEYSPLAPNETREWKFTFGICSDDPELYAFYEKTLGLMPLRLKKWTLEEGEKIEFAGKSREISVVSPSGQPIDAGAPLTEFGLYKIGYGNGERRAEACVYVRPSSDFYLETAAKSALEREEFSSTNCESYYGFFPIFAYLCRVNDEKIMSEAIRRLDKFLSVTLTADETNFVPAANPERVQNLSTVVSILVLAHRATKIKRYLTIAKNLGDRVIDSQHSDGAYYCRGVHYACVIYPVKSLVELADELVRSGEDAGRYADSARRAVENLRAIKTNIGTEGEHTFEDGMITCEALQLALMGIKIPSERDSYVAAAKEVLDEHRCLELGHTPDCRSRGATLRHWEAHYDVLTSRNMTTSPHGWTSWKTYAEYYLYLATNDRKYLVEAFDTLGACLQTTDIKTGEISWAFVIDPCIDANVFERGENGREWQLTPKILGEQYIPMISQWWRADTNIVSTGYGDPRIGRTVGRDYGACCDSDVYEHYKCLGEIGFTSFVHIENGETLAYNCRVENGVILPRAKLTDTARVYSDRDIEIAAFGKKVSVPAGTAVTITRK